MPAAFIDTFLITILLGLKFQDDDNIPVRGATQDAKANALRMLV